MYDDPDLPEALGRTIRLHRIDRDIKRKDLAEQAGISYSYLSAIENGSKIPSARLLYTLARALGVRDDELLAAARQRTAAAPGPPTLAPPAAAAPMAAAAAPLPGGRRRRWRRPEPDARVSGEAEELAELLSRLDPDDAAAVVDLARRLAGDK